MQEKNQKFPFMAIAVVATTMITGTVFAGSTTNKGANPNGKPFIELQGQIIEVEGEVSTLQDQVESLVDSVDDLSLRIEANEDAITALENTNVALQLQITANADDIDSLETQVGTLEGENMDLQVAITALGDADGVLQGEIDTNAAMITTLNQSITDLGVDLQAQIDNNTTLIEIIRDQIDHLTMVDTNRTEIQNGVCPEGETAAHYDQQAQEFICERIMYHYEGQAAVSYPITYRTYSVEAGRTNYLYIHCPAGAFLGWGYEGFIRNISYEMSAQMSILGWYKTTGSNYHPYNYMIVQNDSPDTQIVNMSAECVGTY